MSERYSLITALREGYREGRFSIPSRVSHYTKYMNTQDESVRAELRMQLEFIENSSDTTNLRPHHKLAFNIAYQVGRFV